MSAIRPAFDLARLVAALWLSILVLSGGNPRSALAVGLFVFVAVGLVISFATPVRHEPKHRHRYVRVGYGGAGWSLYRCDCGAEEIDA